MSYLNNRKVVLGKLILQKQPFLMTETWLIVLNGGKNIGNVIVDFREAFDYVDHNLLLQNLSYYKCSDHYPN